MVVSGPIFGITFFRKALAGNVDARTDAIWNKIYDEILYGIRLTCRVWMCLAIHDFIFQNGGFVKEMSIFSPKLLLVNFL